MPHFTLEQGPFAIVPVWVLRLCSPTEVVVYAAIASYADGDGVCKPSYGTISTRCAVHADTVKRAIRSLEAKGILVRHRRTDDRGRSASNAFTLAAVEPPTLLSKTGIETGGADLQSSRTGDPLTTLDQPGPGNPSLRSGSPGAGGDKDPGQRARTRDLVFEAVCEACRLPVAELLPSERGQANKAAKELRSQGVTPAEIVRRGRVAQERWPGQFGPTALVRNWTALGQDDDGDEVMPDAERAAGVRRLVQRRREVV